VIDDITDGEWTAVASIGQFMGSDGPRWEMDGAKIAVVSTDCPYHIIADFSCNHTCRLDMECEANAMLCAAAPDLLAACIGFVNHVDDRQQGVPPFYYEMKAAVAKATGGAK